jgi:CarboxypepD_reg-like domain
MHSKAAASLSISLAALIFSNFVGIPRPALAANSTPNSNIQGGSIKGKVVADIPDQRKPLDGVVVYLSGERLVNKQIQAVSDGEGNFDFAGLLAGEYVFSVELMGFKEYQQKISLQIDATVEHNILCSPFR